MNRTAPLLFFLVFFSGCMSDGPSVSPATGAPATGATIEYVNDEGRSTWITVVARDEEGYLIHERRQKDEDRHLDLLTWVDASGIIRAQLVLCQPKQQDGTCVWGDYHNYSTNSRGVPYLCGALIPPRETSIYAQDAVGRAFYISAERTQGERTIEARSVDTGEVRQKCRLSGAFPPTYIDGDVVGSHMSLSLRGSDGASTAWPNLAEQTMAGPAKTVPTSALPDGKVGGRIIPTEVALQVLHDRAAGHQAFESANPAGISLVSNKLNIRGGGTVGPTVGPAPMLLVEHTRWERELVFYGQDTKDLYVATVSTGEYTTAAANETAGFPPETWVVQEQSGLHEYDGAGLTDVDGAMLVPSITLPDVYEKADAVGLVSGEVASEQYEPTFYGSRQVELVSLNACLERTDGNTTGGFIGLLYTERLCLSTSTGEPTWIIGPWALMKRTLDLPDLDWHEMVFGS